MEGGETHVFMWSNHMIWTQGLTEVCAEITGKRPWEFNDVEALSSRLRKTEESDGDMETREGWMIFIDLDVVVQRLEELQPYFLELEAKYNLSVVLLISNDAESLMEKVNELNVALYCEVLFQGELRMHRILKTRVEFILRRLNIAVEKDKEIMLLRKQSELLQSELSQNQAQIKGREIAAERLIKKYQENLTKVSDIITEGRNAHYSQETGNMHDNMLETLEAIANIFHNETAQGLNVEDLSLDDSTRSWLESTFAVPEDWSIGAARHIRPTEETQNSHGLVHGIPEEEEKQDEEIDHVQAIELDEEDDRKNTRPRLRRLSNTSSGSMRSIGMITFQEAKKADMVIEYLNDDVEWDVWELTQAQMLASVREWLSNYGLVSKYAVKETAISSFFQEVYRKYLPVPYHSIHHGYDVMKTCYFFLRLCGLDLVLSVHSSYSLLIASLCHDIGHPGHTNGFLVKTMSDLAIWYNDRSVLENYHSATAFQIIKAGDDAILGSMTSEEKKQFRQIVVTTILSTDVSTHVKLFRRVNEHSVDHMIQLEVLLCCADVGNVLKAPRISEKWSTLVQQEFFLQGDEEKKNGLQVSPFCDRDKVLCQHQVTVNFIDFVVNPLYNVLQTVYDDMPVLKVIVHVLQQRRASWVELARNTPEITDSKPPPEQGPQENA